MTDREYQKMRADARRGVSRKYGFRQSSYINFKVEDGYFFCLYSVDLLHNPNRLFLKI